MSADNVRDGAPADDLSSSAASIAPEPVPIARDPTGRLMVPGTRVSPDVLVSDFKQGKTPESIHDA